jgi:cyclophilin family peptidyl-prolyl cis-trans isomerase
VRGTLAPILIGLVLALGCGGERSEPEPGAALPAPKPTPPPGTLAVAVLQVRDLGEIRIELLSHEAPKTVASFVALAGSGFYDGTTFHRVVPGFMIQGGDPNTRNRDPRDDGAGGPVGSVPDEPNGVRHLRGVVSMANRGTPNSGGSQFFILVADAPHLDGQHTAFGRVVAGMDVVDRIAAAERDVYGRHGPVDRPLADVVVEKVTVVSPSG